MTDLVVYKNRKLGSFLSIPKSKTLSDERNLEDSIYFARYMRKLKSKSVEELRETEHYKTKMEQYESVLADVDTSSIKDVGTKLRLNIKKYNPVANSVTKHVEGGAVRKSYHDVELLQVSKNTFKPMLHLGGNPNPYANTQFAPAPRRDVVVQPINTMRPVRPTRPMRQQKVTEHGVGETETLKSLVNDLENVCSIFAIKGASAETSDVSYMFSEFIGNSLYNDFHEEWDPSTVVFEELDDNDKDTEEEQIGGMGSKDMDNIMSAIAFFCQAAKPSLLFIRNNVHRVKPVAYSLLGTANSVIDVTVDVAETMMPGVLLDSQKRIYMIIANPKDAVTERFVNEFAAGFVISSKSNPEQINPNKLTLTQKSLLGLVTTVTASNKEDWLKAIGNQIREDILIPIHEVNILKGYEGESKKQALLKTLVDRYSGDNHGLSDSIVAQMLAFLRMIQNDDRIDDEYWRRFQDFASIEQIHIDTSKKIVKRLWKVIFTVLMILVFLTTRYLKSDSLYYNEDIQTPQIEVSDVTNLNSFTRAIVGEMRTQFASYGDVGIKVFDKAILQTIKKHKNTYLDLRNLWFLNVAVLHVRKMAQMYIGDQSIGNSYVPSLSLDTNLGQITLTSILPKIKSIVMIDEPKFQESMYHNCVADVTNHHRDLDEVNSFFNVGNLIYKRAISSETRRDAQIDIISSQLRCFLFLNDDKYKQLLEKLKTAFDIPTNDMANQLTRLGTGISGVYGVKKMDNLLYFIDQLKGLRSSS